MLRTEEINQTIVLKVAWQKLKTILASIIPVWRAVTIKGWNGRSNVDAAISNFGCSLRSALVKHCVKHVLLNTQKIKYFT
jgi:hypothetical protein